MGLVMGIILFIIIFLLALVPTWLLMLAYNYIAHITNHDNWMIPVSLLSVICVAFLLGFVIRLFKSVFGRND